MKCFVFRRESKRWLSMLLLIISTYYFAFCILSTSPVVSCLSLLIVGIGLYILISLKKRNYLNSLALFSAVWMTTIGLSQLRLNVYQTVWSEKTWILLCLGHVSYVLGYALSEQMYPKIMEVHYIKEMVAKFFNFQSEKYKKRLLYLVFFFSYLGIVAFIINVMIRGYIPAFISQNDQSAYSRFYTRYHIFYVASLVTCGFSYYMIKEFKLSRFIKYLLYQNIFILMIVIPLLLVQRGTFLIGALIFLSATYFTGDRSFRSLIIWALMIVLIFAAGTLLRGYTNEKLMFFFPQAESMDDWNIEIPPKVMFIYAYLTVSHENFNSVITHNDQYTYGIWQLKPFNVLIRSDSLQRKISSAQLLADRHMIRNYLNTFSLITMAFYDFGTLGVVVLMFIWSFCFGLLESFAVKGTSPFCIIAYGVCLTPIGLCFMNPWLSEFTIWLLWGTVLLIFLGSCFSIGAVKSKKNS